MNFSSLVRPWACCMLLVAMIDSGYASSLAHSVFLPSDRSSNPFSDPFIQQVTNMDRDKLYSIPQMEDNQFLFHLIKDDDILDSEFHR